MAMLGFGPRGIMTALKSHEEFMEKILSLFNIRINFLEGRQFLLLIVFCLLLIFSYSWEYLSEGLRRTFLICFLLIPLH